MFRKKKLFGRIIPPFFCKSSESDRFSKYLLIRIRFFGSGELFQRTYVCVSNRHMTWWKNAWWIRVDGGPHMRTERGRRRICRAARRAAEQARDGDRVEEIQSSAEEAEGEKWGRKNREQGRNRREESNTLHTAPHLPATATATAATTTAAAAAGTAAAVAATRLQ